MSAAEAATQLATAMSRLEARGGDDLADARDALRAVLDLHGAAIGRLIEIAKSSGGSALVEAWARDELGGHILALHGLHPVPVEQRVRAAVQRVGAELAGEGASLSIVHLRPDVLKLRLALITTGGRGLAGRVGDAICEMAPDAPPIDLDIVVERPEAIVPADRLTAKVAR